MPHLAQHLAEHGLHGFQKQEASGHTSTFPKGRCTVASSSVRKIGKNTYRILLIYKYLHLPHLSNDKSHKRDGFWTIVLSNNLIKTAI
ncbi:Putative protein [Zobellia galactanivorans]|uniref:Uncharacterized protein n=1 Tax=Zobellia galactanivorans (strain DSM 12802 / CCUG 47099 / CIP 106680 / NCIMB 13871 / Dsij) TaxID=63186 RepID=G0L6Q8_ZOBGA|nr:Putative protein [Zobellia galactanivorans]